MNNCPQAVLAELRAGHRRFLDGESLHPHSSRERMLEVESGQHPTAAVLGCADSRVPVELLFDTGFGDLFVVRNAGTLSTTAAIASLEYAVAHLGVPVIVVLGHERCGAVEAALNPALTLTPSLAQVVEQLRMELLHLDLQGVRRPAPYPAHGLGDGAAGGEMVVLDQDAVGQAHPVVVAAPGMDGGLFEEAPTGRRLAGVEDAYRGISLGPGGPLNVVPGLGGDAAETLKALSTACTERCHPRA